MTVAFDPSNWKDLNPMSLDDLWLIDRRGQHAPEIDYEPLPGGFIPEVPYWLMLRFSKPGWTVYDPMAGAMVTRRVGDKIARDVISVDLTDRGQTDDPMYHELILADARDYDPGPLDMIIWHPPYGGAIRFSDDADDMSTMSEMHFWRAVDACLYKFNIWLKPDRMVAIVIGNIYQNREIVPLPALMCQSVCQIVPWVLKGWVVKNITGNRPGQVPLWRARAAAGDTFRFAHEVIQIWHKPPGTDWYKTMDY